MKGCRETIAVQDKQPKLSKHMSHASNNSACAFPLRHIITKSQAHKYSACACPLRHITTKSQAHKHYGIWESLNMHPHIRQVPPTLWSAPPVTTGGQTTKLRATVYWLGFAFEHCACCPLALQTKDPPRESPLPPSPIVKPRVPPTKLILPMCTIKLNR